MKSGKKISSPVKKQISNLFSSICFLTIIPLPKSLRTTDDFGNALFYFGPVGFLIGFFAIILSSIFSLFPQAVSAAVLTVYLSLISGFLHLDGLADTADGLMSHRERKRCLEIMKDSRIGVMGAAAIVSLFILKYSTLSVFPPNVLIPVVLVVPIAGRTAIVLTMAFLPYARIEGGLGQLFYSKSTRMAAIFSFLFLILATAAVQKTFIFPVIVSLLLTVISFSFLCRNKIGGATGDTLGAVCELTEVVTLLSLTLTIKG